MADYLQRELQKNKLIAYNKEKANELLQSFGIDFPNEEAFISFGNSIAHSLENVKYPSNNNFNPPK